MIAIEDSNPASDAFVLGTNDPETASDLLSVLSGDESDPTDAEGVVPFVTARLGVAFGPSIHPVSRCRAKVLTMFRASDERVVVAICAKGAFSKGMR